jgi:crotonobetainyl-CoA:carnitine CoA-transferase CaiB-like acyl-CoA transferase
MLDGLPVLDLTDHRGEIGPRLLAELGADVVKVEPPGGTSARRALPMYQGASLQFAVYNTDKRLVELDPADASDRSAFRELVAGAEIIVDSGPPGMMAAFGIDRTKLVELNPTVVTVLVTAVGADGPRAADPHSELTIAALGGPVRIQGAPERAPVKVSVPQVWRHAGAEAALAALVAKARADQLGQAQFVDLSAQSVMTWTMLNAMEAQAIQGFDFERTGATLELAMTMPLRRECVDGHVILVPRGANGGRLVPWMIEDEVVDGSWADEDWATFDARTIDGEETAISHDELIAAMDRLCSRYTKRELLARGLEVGVTIAPVNNLADLLAFDHLDVRSFWRQFQARSDDAGGLAPFLGQADGAADRGDGGHDEIRAPGSFVTIDGQRLSSDPLVNPVTGSSSAQSSEPVRFDRSTRAKPRPRSGPAELPFDGLRVADFSWIGVGPMTAKNLADHGATVVRVESANRIDGLRVQPPFKDGESGINRSHFFGTFNTSKQSLSIDLKNEGGLRVAKRLVEWADVVIDSWTPGAMARLGLGPDDIRAVNPNVITVTTSLLGGGGPHSSMAGYGYHAAAIAGYFDLVGWPDLPPDGPWLAYTDTIGPRFIGTALLAALDRRARTGAGCHIEAAQLEIALQLLGPELLHHELDGASLERAGNRDPGIAPQGVYPCKGDDCWVAISVLDDQAWSRLRVALGDPGWAKGAILDTVDGRAANHDAIDTAISAWTSERTEAEVEADLLAAGIAVAPVQRSSNLLADPQYAHRSFYRWLEHDEVGSVPYAGHSYRIEGYDNGPRSAAPLLGHQSFEVLTELLGFSEDEVGEIAATGCLE